MITGEPSGILRLVSIPTPCGYSFGQRRHAFPHLALSRKEICAGYVRDVSSSSEVGCRGCGHLVYQISHHSYFTVKAFGPAQTSNSRWCIAHEHCMKISVLRSLR
jgi:hypothetical protein